MDPSGCEEIEWTVHPSRGKVPFKRARLDRDSVRRWLEVPLPFSREIGACPRPDGRPLQEALQKIFAEHRKISCKFSRPATRCVQTLPGKEGASQGRTANPSGRGERDG